MSAIFGALALSGTSLPDGLGARMQAALVHRFSDREQRLEGPDFVLGARSFHTTSEARAETPFVTDERTGVSCVFDGRLDYRQQLADVLSLPSVASLSDERLILAAYAAFGTSFCERLEGDFALALWDAKARRLVLARDALGVRPLCFAQLDGLLLFASEPRALFAHQRLSQRLNPFRVAAYLAGVFPDTNQTFFAGVDRLPPGHRLVVEDGRLHVRRFVSLHNVAALKLASSSDYSEAFRAAFVGAVRERMRTHLPVGCMLSGGLDSAGVLGALRSLGNGHAVPCFSARFLDFPEVDEGPFLDLHRQRGGVAIHEVRADRVGPLDDIDALHDALGEPFHAPNLFIYDQLTKLARAQGVSVMFDGLDGDTVVEHGLFFLNELLHRGRLRRLGRELRALHRRAGFSYPFLLRAWALEPDLARLRALASLLPMSAEYGWLTPRFARASGFLGYLRADARAQLAAPTAFRDMHARAINAPIMSFYLEAHDRLAAVHGVDPRHPFFDLRLVKLCLALPPEQRLFDGWDRVIERRAFVGLCPEPIRARQSKSVWTANFQRQLLAHNGPALQAALSLSPHPLEGVVDLGRMRRELSALRPGAEPRRVLRIWDAVTLTRWLVRTGRSV